MNQTEKDLINEKFRGVYSRLDANDESIHNKLDLIWEEVKETNLRVTKLEDETAFWRWMQRKPKRFALIAGFLWLMTIQEVRMYNINMFKSFLT